MLRSVPLEINIEVGRTITSSGMKQCKSIVVSAMNRADEVTRRCEDVRCEGESMQTYEDDKM